MTVESTFAGTLGEETSAPIAGRLEQSDSKLAGMVKPASAEPQPSTADPALSAYKRRQELLQRTLHVLHNGVATLSPRELTVAHEHLPRKVLIFERCSAENWGFHRSNPTKTPADFLLVNNLQQLPARTADEIGEYDFQVVNFPLRFVMHDSLSQASKPIIRHRKVHYRMNRYHLKGELGDRLQAVMCAADCNIRWLLRMIVLKGLRGRLLQSASLPDFGRLSGALISKLARFTRLPAATPALVS